ncbi:hypothetical protein IJH15_02630 [Candidatus Saccharibacteria bacterium]|jgi:hypothetical protein|nr:hypothetical protein [Candidatus Saccharibacteria bacterium]MBR3253197.1 hypothetical protein [Candidatus Saccharibacteria bacterium]
MLKTDLATSIVAAIIGLLIAFFVANLLTGEIEPFTYRTIETTVNADLGEPNREVFNYRALNPTVEVYVGSCAEYDSNGECIEIYDEDEEEDEEDNGDSGTDQENG